MGGTVTPARVNFRSSFTIKNWRVGVVWLGMPRPCMNLETASKNIELCRGRMDALYQKSVFDEWAVVKFEQGSPSVLAYVGPRAERFSEQFHHDSGLLFAEMQGKQYDAGDFEFVAQARGSRFDACMCLGEATYLFCNNTFGTMGQLRADARWLEAQKPFVALTEKFRADPLV